MLDIIRKNLELTSQMQETSFEAILVTMLVATVCGFIIYFVYRLFFKGVVYSENFNLLIVLVCVITAFIIRTISVNLVLSLGMVGALSIVRFRAAVKDPLDVGFIYWAVSAGLTSGAQLYGTALLCTIFIAFLYIITTFIKKDKSCYLLIVRYNPSGESDITAQLSKLKYKLKNKTQTSDVSEITIELKLKNNNADVIEKFNAIQTVQSCVLLEYSGDYAN